MAKQFSKLSRNLIDFIQKQRVFFVATAPDKGKINLSPKGLDSLKILGPERLIWLNLTGSGNETAAHVLENCRMTIMFCAFEGPPLILRLYGESRCIYPYHSDWHELINHFPDYVSARQIFDLNIEMAQTSCGFGVPLLDYRGDRDQLLDWADQKGTEGLEAYWHQKNVISLDGNPTGIKDKAQT